MLRPPMNTGCVESALGEQVPGKAVGADEEGSVQVLLRRSGAGGMDEPAGGFELDAGVGVVGAERGPQAVERSVPKAVVEPVEHPAHQAQHELVGVLDICYLRRSSGSTPNRSARRWSGPRVRFFFCARAPTHRCGEVPT
jgi:hypothetical protein